MYVYVYIYVYIYVHTHTHTYGGKGCHRRGHAARPPPGGELLLTRYFLQTHPLQHLEDRSAPQEQIPVVATTHVGEYEIHNASSMWQKWTIPQRQGYEGTTGNTHGTYTTRPLLDVHIYRQKTFPLLVLSMCWSPRVFLTRTSSITCLPGRSKVLDKGLTSGCDLRSTEQWFPSDVGGGRQSMLRDHSEKLSRMDGSWRGNAIKVGMPGTRIRQ